MPVWFARLVLPAALLHLTLNSRATSKARIREALGWAPDIPAGGSASSRASGTCEMIDRAAAARFLDGYAAAFVRFDAPTVADLFSYPCQLTADDGEIAVTAVSTREAWLPQVERLLAAYRRLGVASATVVDLRLQELTPRLSQAAVRWRLADAADGLVYEFDASYTLGEFGDAIRITAIAHSETAQLRAAMGATRSGRASPGPR